MTAQKPDQYKKGVYINEVLEAASWAGVRLSEMTVLFYLCKWSKPTGPFVDQSKPQIQEALGLSRTTVQLALQSLTARGIIQDWANRHGGNGRGYVGWGVTRRLNIIWTPEQKAEAKNRKRARKTRENGPEDQPKTGQNFEPLNTTKLKQGNGEGVPFRHGRTDGQLDAGASPGTLAPPMTTDTERALMAAFAKDVKAHGFGEARQRDKARRARVAAGEGL